MAGENDMVLCGSGGLPVYGRQSTLLYGAPAKISATVTIAWEGGDDVDVCAFYSVGGGSIGWNWDSTSRINYDGFSAVWGGDNTRGGPETIKLSYAGKRASVAGVTFSVHVNWYSVSGEDDAPTQGGKVTVTVDGNGRTLQKEIVAGGNRHQRASSSDPGVTLSFNGDGSIKDLT